MIRLALIGTGSSAGVYDFIGSRVHNAQIVAFADEDCETAEEFANDHREPIPAYPLEKLFSKYADAFDAVLVHTEINSRESICQTAAEAGKHVLVETPMAESSNGAEQVIQACHNADVRLMIGDSSRFLPEVQVIRDSLDSGKLGEPGLLRIHRWAASGKDFCAKSTHRLVRDIDLATWFFQSVPSQVFANTSSLDGEYYQLHLGFDKGGMAVINWANLPPGDNYYALSLIGSTGAAYADDHHNMQLVFGGGSPSVQRAYREPIQYIAELQEFINAIEQNREPTITGEDGRLALLIAEAAAKSIAQGRAFHRRGENYEVV